MRSCSIWQRAGRRPACEDGKLQAETCSVRVGMTGETMEFRERGDPMNVLRCVVLVLLCIFPGSGWCQSEENERLTLPVRPQVGQAWDVNILHNRTSARDRKVLGSHDWQVAGRMEVIGVSEDGFDILWTVKTVSGDGILIDGIHVDPELMIGIPVEGHLDVFGTPLMLKDWDTLRDRLVAGLERFPETAIDAERRQYFRNMIDGWDSSLAAKALLNHAALTSLCQGTDLIVGSPLQGTEMVPDLLGGMPMLAHSTYLLEPNTPGSRIAAIVFTRKLDPDSTADRAKEYLRRLAVRTGEDADRMMELLTDFKIVNDFSADCLVDIDTGFVMSADAKALITIGNHSVLDHRHVIQWELPWRQ